MLGIRLLLSQEPRDQPVALVRGRIGHESLDFVRRREQPDKVQRHAADQRPIVGRFARPIVMRPVVAHQPQVDRVGRMADGRRGQNRMTGLERRRGRSAKRETRLPRHPLIDPRPQHADLMGRQPRPFFGHHAIRLQSGDQTNQQALRALAGHDNRPRIAPFEHPARSSIENPPSCFALAWHLAQLFARIGTTSL